MNWGKTVAGAVIAIVVILLASGVAGSGVRPISATTETAVAGSTGAGAVGAASAGSAAGAARQQTVLQELDHSGIPSSDIHLPDLSVAPPSPGELVSPTYSQAPAPMGVSDLGLTNVSGHLKGSVLDTSSVEGTITLTNALSVNVDGDGPDMYGIQLNAVVTGITLFGNSSNEFWTQNFVSYTPSSGELVFGDNVWNFSNYDAYISPNVFYATGPNGTLYAPVYYYAIGPTFTIHYPFTITFYENSSVLYDRPAVFFNYTVSKGSWSTSGSYDYVVFNATTSQAPKLRHAVPAGVYQINGQQVDPVGLPNDLELDVVGNDDGDTTSFYAMDAALSIGTWDSTTHAYAPAKSAYDSGSETGETSDGIEVSYSGATPVADLTLGPSFLYGLWGLSSDSGRRTVAQQLSPANTLLLVNPGTSVNQSEAQWVPTSPSGLTTFSLPNLGDYTVQYVLSDHDPGSAVLATPANSTTSRSFTGALNDALGVYTPLIAFGNSELPGISSGGSGTVTNPYVILNNEYGAILPEFAAWNDYQWPVFPGLLLYGTTDYVSVTSPSFAIVYPSWMTADLEEFGLPGTNNLQLWFWDSEHVVVRGGTISGWLSAFLEGFPEGSIVFWNTSDSLVAGTTFLDQGDAIVLYGGTDNTIWGSHFYAVSTTASEPDDVLNSGVWTQAVNESESGDLIYNNYVDVPFPAITPTYDPLSCQINCEPAVYLDAWNVAVQPASDVRVVDGVALSGSILGYSWQGGNYWSNYGTASDPYGVLPYNNSGAIAYGGDYAPLSPPLYRVTFVESGLPGGTLWSVTLNGVTLSSNGRAITFEDPDGTYAFSAPAVHHRAAVPSHGSVTVSGRNVGESVNFV